MSKLRVLIQVQVVITVSAPSLKNTKRGKRLIKNAVLTAVLTWVVAQVGF